MRARSQRLVTMALLSGSLESELDAVQFCKVDSARSRRAEECVVRRGRSAANMCPRVPARFLHSAAPQVNRSGFSRLVAALLVVCVRYESEQE